LRKKQLTPVNVLMLSTLCVEIAFVPFLGISAELGGFKEGIISQTA